MANLPLHMGSRVQEGEGGGVTQHACLHFAESRSSVFLQSFAHFLWPTPPQPGFALGLHRRCTVFESSVVHVVGSSSAAQLTDSMDGGGADGGGGEGGCGGGVGGEGGGGDSTQLALHAAGRFAGIGHWYSFVPPRKHLSASRRAG